MECIHLLDESTCSFCKGTVTELPKPKPPRDYRELWLTPSAPVDAEAVLAGRIADGEVCGSCLTERAPLGCECSRRRHYDRQVVNTVSWVVENVDDGALPAKTSGAALAFGVQSRLARRAVVPADEHDATRRGITQALELKPTWRQPRVNHPDHLPV